METSSMSKYTATGLLLAFFGAPLIIALVSYAEPGALTNALVVVRELLLFGAAGMLLLLILKGEKKGLDSVGLHNRHWGKSLLRSLLLLIACLVVGVGCLVLLNHLGVPFGEGGEAGRYKAISPWVITLMVARAGVVEELFYRGYIMERLEAWSGRWLVYFLLPVVLFGLLHYRQGIGGILISFVLGLIFAWYYWKKRDLKANIIAHFLVDFIPNVLLPLFDPTA